MRHHVKYRGNKRPDTARKEHVSSLFLNKGCSAADLAYDPPANPAIYAQANSAPAQVATVILASCVLIGVATAIVAIPIGLWLHGRVLHQMAHVAATGLPNHYLTVYSAYGLGGTAAIATIVAIAGALVPATWAGRARAAHALRAE